jgi:serine/threonine-protein kinase
MSDVYRGKHLVTGADVAVKILEPCAHVDEDAVERFRTEARVSALLAHRSIVRVFDLLEEEDGTLALVMERLVGVTLEERIARDGALDADIAVAIAVPILGALDHAHAVGVVHRDVKPGNVFLAVEPDGRVTPKLLDFGVAKSDACGVRTMDGRVLGTARYVSPEQARGEKLDGRSDVFSMATVVYEAMTGESPFSAREAKAALVKVLELPVDAHERIPPRVWSVLSKALAKQTYARHATAAAFASALVTATGKTDEELAALLRDERPPLPKLDTPPVVTISEPPRSRRAARRLWPIPVAFAAGAAIVATLALTHTSSPTIAAPPPPPPPPQPTTSVAPPLVATQTSPPPASQAPTPPPTQRHAPPPTTTSAKAIATTPGF